MGSDLIGENKVFEKSSKIGAPLAKLNVLIGWELLRLILNEILKKSTNKGIALVRAKLNDMLTSLTYNLFRVGQIKKVAQIQREKCA